MTLYLYRTGTSVPILTIENACAYTDSEIQTEDGTIYGPFAEDVELSSLEDCSETLRADWRRAHPQGGQTEAVEDPVSALFAAIERGLA